MAHGGWKRRSGIGGDHQIGWQMAPAELAALVEVSDFICAQLLFLLLPCMARLAQKNAA